MPGLTIHDVALLVRRAPATIRRWTSSGRLPAILFGGRLLIDQEDWDKMVRPPGSFHRITDKRRNGETQK
jgi:hypothetical protein